jgi:hypothetical protein
VDDAAYGKDRALVASAVECITSAITVLKTGALAQEYSSDLWTLGLVGRLIETFIGQRYCGSGGRAP